jgi:uroporphyrin-III C-methyltransferase/precorrin-2 dehydrogenase/sirohydrochlorin ferrochelatase
VDDNDNASVYLGGVVRKGGVTLAISTDGTAPALAGLLREGLEAVLPEELQAWRETAQALRARWKAEAVPMAERRPLLLTALNQIYARRRAAVRPKGFVSLVGAGPGDPDLLTVKASRLLGEADVVYYDALVDARVLALAPQAHCFSVGKRCGRVAIAQETIHKLIIRAARQGKRVVRLKGGDPFVFGRGGEEALALAAAGIPFEVVPGVSNAVAAPALAGIPVTHRGAASAFVAVSGHAESTFRPVLSTLAPGSATVVVLMGLHNQVPVAETLRDAGWREATPAAVIFAAGTDTQHVWRGTLAGLLAGPVDRPAGDPPGTLVIGDVVALSAAIGAAPPLAEPMDEDDDRRTNAGA